MGADNVVTDSDMELQPLVTHTAAWPFCFQLVMQIIF